MAQYDVDLRDYWRIIRKRKVVIVLMVLLVGVCSYGFAKLSEPIPLYEANSAIKIATHNDNDRLPYGRALDGNGKSGHPCIHYDQFPDSGKNR